MSYTTTVEALTKCLCALKKEGECQAKKIDETYQRIQDLILDVVEQRISIKLDHIALSRDIESAKKANKFIKGTEELILLQNRYKQILADKAKLAEDVSEFADKEADNHTYTSNYIGIQIRMNVIARQILEKQGYNFEYTLEDDTEQVAEVVVPPTADADKLIVAIISKMPEPIMIPSFSIEEIIMNEPIPIVKEPETTCDVVLATKIEPSPQIEEASWVQKAIEYPAKYSLGVPIFQKPISFPIRVPFEFPDEFVPQYPIEYPIRLPTECDKKVDLWYVHSDTPVTVANIIHGMNKPSRLQKERVNKQIETMWIERRHASNWGEEGPYNFVATTVSYAIRQNYDYDVNILKNPANTEIVYDRDGQLLIRHPEYAFIPYGDYPRLPTMEAGELCMIQKEPCIIPIVKRKPFTPTRQMLPDNDKDRFTLQHIPSGIAGLIIKMVIDNTHQKKRKIQQRAVNRQINELTQENLEMEEMGVDYGDLITATMYYRKFRVRSLRYETVIVDDWEYRPEYVFAIDGLPLDSPLQPTRIGDDGEVYNVTGRVVRTDNNRLYAHYN